MPLSLSAEQKELLKIFKIEEQYIIPSYQRPYSWEYDQCFQLYSDLHAAYREKQDYFIGNIIIAKADNSKDIFEVVDGQQRIVTLLILFKALSFFQPDLKILNQLIEQEDWTGENKIPRIKSEVFEAKDDFFLNKVLNYSAEKIEVRLLEVVDKNGKIVERLCESKFECNTLYFYNWIKFFLENNGNLNEFTQFILRQVYLLPIELNGHTREEAGEKALVIFETINNRGMNLEDADIFKAKLYNKAKSVNEANIFIEQWSDFKNYCENLKLDIDDVFRYYSHIIRGREGITSSEKNLREFFTNEKFSPFELKNYSEILEDLFRIIGILEFLSKEKITGTETAKWLQIIDAYTNQYPKYAIVNYLYVNSLELSGSLVIFLKSLIRYIYYQGSTSTVKFEIYNIIKQTTFKQEISSYRKSDINADYFNYLGRLKKGFALLAFYQSSKTALTDYNIDKIINLKDKQFLSPDWEDINIGDIVDKLGNTVILDLPKKYVAYLKKKEYYSTSKLQEIKSIFGENDFTYSDFLKRDKMLRELLTNFFKEI